MSRADERLRKQLADLADAQANARPGEDLETFDRAARSWRSRCVGARDGTHCRLRVNADGSWRCQWCAHDFDPPPALAGVTWTLCQGQIDLAKPLGVQRRRGTTPLFVYECPACHGYSKRLAVAYAGRNPLPPTGWIVCGKQVPKQGAA